MSARSAPHSLQRPTLIPAPIVTNPWIVLLVLTLGFFMILLDTTVVNVAIPAMERGLNASFDSILWVLNGYILVYAVLLISTGRLGDTIGPKKLFIAGLALFTVASAACGFSQNGTQLIIFRVLQGAGGAILTPQTLSMLPHIFPPEKRGAAFGVWGAVSGLAAVLGPTLGGFLVTTFDWQSIFFVNIPVGVVAIIAALVLMPDLRSDRRHNFDIAGLFLASGGLLMLVYAIIEGEKYRWGPINSTGSFFLGSTHWSLVSIYSLIVYAVVVLSAFVWWETRVPEPLLPLSLFSDRNFSGTSVVGMAVGFAMFSLFIPLTIFLQTVLGYSAVHAGLALVPLSIGLLVVSPFAGRLSDRVNGKYILMGGIVIAGIGIIFLAQVLTLHSSPWVLLAPLVITGAGMGCTFAPMTTLALRDVNPSMSGAASGFITTSRQVAGALGASTIGAVLSTQIVTELPRQAANLAGRLPSAYRAGFLSQVQRMAAGSQNYGAGQQHAAHAAPGIPLAVAHQLAALGQLAFDQAFVNAIRPTLYVVALGLITGLFSAFLLRGGGSANASRGIDESVESRVPVEVSAG